MKGTWESHSDSKAGTYWRLEFQLLGKQLDPEDSTAIEQVATRDVGSDAGLVLSGRGPIWFFHDLLERFSAARWAAIRFPRWRGSVVVRRQPGATVTLGDLIADPETTLALCPGDENFSLPRVRLEPHRLDGIDSAQLLRISVRGGDLHGPNCLAEAGSWLPLRAIAAHPRVPYLLLSGEMSLWLAAAIIDQLRREFPDRTILLDDPRRARAIAMVKGEGTPAMAGRTVPHAPREPLAPCVALVGDPQSGKSTLSWKLYHALQRMGVRSYRLDCDAQAPTAPWGTGPGESTRRDYKAARGEWNAEDVEILLRQAQDLKRSDLNLVLLDMPGGNLRANPPERIPADRVRLFQEAQFFVRLDKDEHARRGWTRALDEVGLAERIIAVVRPCAGDSLEEFWPDGVADDDLPQFGIHRLDRTFLYESSPAVEQLARLLLARAKIDL